MESKAEPHKRYICSFLGCSAAYNKQWKLDAHLCKHTGVKPHRCERAGCGKSFCTAYHLARHELSHAGVKAFRCSVDGCAEAFTTSTGRSRHVGRFHAPEQKTYVCKLDGCGMEFRKNKQRRSHMCEQHAHVPAYPCTHDGCHMTFTFPSKLKRHEKVHKGYPCKEEGCTFTGKTWTEYLRHRKERHKPLVRCDLCGKEFRDSWFLQQHQSVHSDVRVVVLCPRDGCVRSFTTAYNLQCHINSFHDGLRPFACAYAGCGKAFATKKNLQRHGVLHDPQRAKQKKPRPKRGLASRLSGYDESKGERGTEPEPNPPGSVELVSLLQDTSLLCSTVAVDSLGLNNAVTAPLSV